MTIAELIGLVDGLVQDVPFEDDVKLLLVNQVEGLIQHDCFRMDPADVAEYTAQDVSAGTELLLGAPFSEIYVAWMKAMYYRHMGEYNSYENEKAMFDNEWERLCRTVAEARAHGTSKPPEWATGLPTRLLAGRLMIVPVSYDRGTGTVVPSLTFAQIREALTEHACLPVCTVEYGGMTLFLPLAITSPQAMVFTSNWEEDQENTYVHAALVLAANG